MSSCISLSSIKFLAHSRSCSFCFKQTYAECYVHINCFHSIDSYLRQLGRLGFNKFLHILPSVNIFVLAMCTFPSWNFALRNNETHYLRLLFSMDPGRLRVHAPPGRSIAISMQSRTQRPRHARHSITYDRGAVRDSPRLYIFVFFFFSFFFFHHHAPSTSFASVQAFNYAGHLEIVDRVNRDYASQTSRQQRTFLGSLAPLPSAPFISYRSPCSVAIQ